MEEEKIHNEFPTPPSLFQRTRTIIVTGLVVGFLVGPCANMTALFFTWGIRDSFLVAYPLSCICGLVSGIVIVPVCGFLGSYVAIKTGKENSVNAYGYIGVFIGTILLLCLMVISA